MCTSLLCPTLLWSGFVSLRGVFGLGVKFNPKPKPPSFESIYLYIAYIGVGMSVPDPVVSIAKAESQTQTLIKDAIRRALSHLDRVERYFKPGDFVLLKPNMCWGGTGLRETTHPVVTASVAEICLECGASRVVVGESSGTGVDTDGVYNSTGTRELAVKAGAEVVDFKDDDYITVDNSDGRYLKSFKVARLVVEADVRINLPMMKIDCPTTFSCSIKNWAGVLHDDDKVEVLHRRGMPWNLAELHRKIGPDLVIVDGLEPPEVFPGKISRNMGLILAGDDPVAVDTVGSRLIGVDPSTIMNTSVASEYGLGVNNLDQITVRGRSVNEEVIRYNLPPRTVEELKQHPGFDGIKVVDHGRCSGCLQSLLFTWEKSLKEKTLHKIQGLCIHIGGNEAESMDEEKVMYLGNCVEDPKGRLHVPGCMPYSSDILKGLKKIGKAKK